MIYAAPVERQGTGQALLEVPQPGLGGEVALVMLGCAGPGWDQALDPLNWRQPREQPVAPQPEQPLSLHFGTWLVPELSFICQAGQIKRLFALSPCPTVTATCSACHRTLCGARMSFGLCFGDRQRKAVCTNPVLDLTAQWGWVQDERGHGETQCNGYAQHRGRGHCEPPEDKPQQGQNPWISYQLHLPVLSLEGTNWP